MSTILQLISDHVYADDCTCTCQNHESTAKAEHINDVLSLITSWGRRWQATLAPEKTQHTLISCRQSTNPSISVDGKTLDLTREMSILRVQLDNLLTFTGHVKDAAKRAARKLACGRRISYLESKSCYRFYNLVSSLMEYFHLVWSSCLPSFLSLFDRMQH